MTIINQDIAKALASEVKSAYASKTPLYIQGGGSKTFYGLPVKSDSTLDITPHQGIVAYDPPELAITVRAGTKLSELEALLDEHNQQLPFEPPHFSDNTTIGGMVATGLSGPRRAAFGSVRDAVLGVKIINGKGELLQFGGQVMKNVAGYDISRLMAGSLGILGVIVEVSLRVMPKAAFETTIPLTHTHAQHIEAMRDYAKQTLPITATAWLEGKTYVRLSSSEENVTAAIKKIGGDTAFKASCWQMIRDHQHAFFQNNSKQLWRLTIAPASKPVPLEGDTLIEWSGAQRWITTNAPAEIVIQTAKNAGGYAICFDPDMCNEKRFTALNPWIKRLHQNIKKAFDPENILNPGRMYHDL